MANEYAVNQADLAAVADAIREKSGTTDALTFPGGFVDAVGAIQAGSGELSAEDQTIFDALSNKKTAVYNTRITYLRPYAFRDCNASSFEFPNLTGMGSNVFEGCTSAEYIILPKIYDWTGNCFKNCFNVKKIDGAPSKVNTGHTNLHAIQAIIIRGDSVPTLNGSSPFPDSPLVGYGGTYSGHIYVKQELISSYQTATNWSVLYANYPEIFQPIEGSEYE